MHQLGGDLYVKKATVEFNASARMDDQLDVGMKCGRIGNSSMAFTGAIFRGDELLITCELIYVFADPASQTSRPVPPLLREILSGYEAGEGMVQVKTGSWADLGNDAKKIRTEVFVEEQRIPADMEWDEADAAAVHAVAYNRLGQPVATGRLLQPRPGVAKIGRMAVHKVLRGSGVGRQVLEKLLARPPRGAIRKPFCMPSAAPRTSISAWDSSRAARRSRKRESPISRCHGRSRASHGPQEKKPTGTGRRRRAQADRACGCCTRHLAGRSRWQQHGCHVGPHDVPGAGPGRAA